MRTFSDLPGHIDCQIILVNEEIPEQETLIAIPACMCEVKIIYNYKKDVNPEELKQIEEIYQSKRDSEENKIKNIVQQIQETVEKHERFEKETKGNLEEKDMQDILSSLSKNEAQLNALLETIKISAELQVENINKKYRLKSKGCLMRLHK